MSDFPCTGVDEGEFDFITMMFRTNVDQHSPCMHSSQPFRVLEFAFDLGWPIMTGPGRDYGISYRT